MKITKAKRLAAIVIALILILSLIPLQAQASSPTEHFGASALASMENGENLTWAYNTLGSGIEANQGTISFEDESHSVNNNDFQTVWNAFLADNPQYFWLAQCDTISSGGKVTAVEPYYDFIFTADELPAAKAAFDAATAKALSGITNDMSQYEIELYLHDYLVNNVKYVNGTSNTNNAYGALVNGQAVCEGYADAFQYLLTQAGISSCVVTGTSKGEGHAWNLVKIDGEYYYVDVTWDDQDNGKNFYAYFNVTTAQLEEDHTIIPEFYTPPICTATAANYFTVNGGKIESGDIDTICRMMDAGNLTARVYVTGDADAFKTWWDTNKRTIANTLGVTGSRSFSWSRVGREFLLQITGDYTHAHDLIHIDAVAATCRKEGNVEYWSCSKCGKNYADADATQELTSIITAMDANNHEGGTELKDAVEATCEHTGYTGDTYCKGCDAKLSSGTVIPAGHKLTHVDAVAATCKDTGTKEHWHCSVCDKDFADSKGATALKDLTLAKDPANHVGGTVIKNKTAATCTVPGNTGDTYCKGCDAKLSSGTVIPAGHKLTHVDAVAATCKDTGTKEHWHCSVCDKDFADSKGATALKDLTLAKDPANHVGGTVIKNKTAATCTVPGNTGDTYCKGCDAKLSSGTVIPAGHKLTHVDAVAATCKDTGTKEHWHCSVCDKDFADSKGATALTDVTIAKDPNNHVGFKSEWATDADGHWHACTGCATGKSGFAAHVFDNACDTTCNTCGYTRTTNHVPAVDYRYNDNGHWKVCAVCGETVEAMEAHKGGTATCIAKAVCSVCNQPYGSTADHDVTNWQQTKAPTFTQPGEKTATCTVCKKDIKAPIPMLTQPMDGKDSGNTKLIKSDLTGIPAQLKDIETLNTLDKIRAALSKAILENNSSVADSNIKYYDVSVMLANLDDEYVPITPENLPENGEITILLAYPEGTNKTGYTFYASHIITDARYGEVGTVEAPTVKATDNGLEITLHGTSPVALGWYKTESSSSTGSGSAATPTQPENSTVATGDMGALIYALCAVCALGLCAVLVSVKRRRH